MSNGHHSSLGRLFRSSVYSRSLLLRFHRQELHSVQDCLVEVDEISILFVSVSFVSLPVFIPHEVSRWGIEVLQDLPPLQVKLQILNVHYLQRVDSFCVRISQIRRVVIIWVFLLLNLIVFLESELIAEVLKSYFINSSATLVFVFVEFVNHIQSLSHIQDRGCDTQLLYPLNLFMQFLLFWVLNSIHGFLSQGHIEHVVSFDQDSEQSLAELESVRVFQRVGNGELEPNWNYRQLCLVSVEIPVRVWSYLNVLIAIIQLSLFLHNSRNLHRSISSGQGIESIVAFIN